VASAQLTFGVLGALEVHRDGAAVPLPSSRQRAVLAALLVHAGRPVPGDTLVEAAWRDELPANPRAALHTVLSRLRTALDADAIRHEAAGYRLAITSDAVDATLFETLHRAAREAPATEAVGLLDRALALWRGPAYAEFADRVFAAAEAVRLDELRLACLEDLAELRLEIGDVSAALTAMESFVDEHPLRERARGLLMMARYRAGRVSEALDTYHEYRNVLVDELGLDPSPAIRDLHQRILNHEVTPSPPARQSHPASTVRWLATDAPFLGRNNEAAELLELGARHRLVTVTGAGGVGKTRLVAETVSALAGQLGLPVTVVELAAVDDDGVDSAIAAAMGVGSSHGNPREAALDYLSVLPALLVLDNCEHVLTGLRPFVHTALRRCAGLRVVATSRQRIGLPAEQVLPLEPLPTPEVDAEAAELNVAVRLFADRARRVRPAFGLTDADVPAVAEICRRLDGLPLAIELAATRAATLGIEPLRRRLDSSLDLLGGGGRTEERTLRVTLDWSYGLLDEADRTLFAALGVFEGDFDLDAAEQMTGGLAGRPVAVGLGRLVDASLVVARQAVGTVRYRLLEVVRAFARERLAEANVEPDIRAAHARWVRAMMRAAAEAATGPGDDPLAASLIDAADVRAAALWALRHGEPELAGDITGSLMFATVHRDMRVDLIDVVRLIGEEPAVEAAPSGALARAAGAFAATLQGELEMGEHSARAALIAARSANERYLALCALGVVAIYRGDYDSSRRWWRELLTVEELQPAQLVDGHASLSLLAAYEGEVSEARQHAARAMAMAEASGSPPCIAFASYAAAEAVAAADYATGVPLLETAVREVDRAGADFSAGLAATALAAALTRLDRTAEALDVVGPLLERWLRLAAWPQLWTTMRILAELLVRNDRPEEAALLLAAAVRAPSAPAIAGTDIARYARLDHELRQRIDAQAYEKIATLAAFLPRTAVVDRARAAVAALSQLRDGPPAQT
jgi:predicted ATPase/DNA-binding winged helix-turn-helix (wHTH) protein